MSSALNAAGASFMRQQQRQQQIMPKLAATKIICTRNPPTDSLSASIPETTASTSALVISSSAPSTPSASTSSSLSSSCESNREILKGSLCPASAAEILTSTAATALKAATSEISNIFTASTPISRNNDIITASTSETLSNICPPSTTPLLTTSSSITSVTSSPSMPVLSNTAISMTSSSSSPTTLSTRNVTNNGTAINNSTSPSSAQLLLNGIVASGCNNSLNSQQQLLVDDSHTLQLALELSMVGMNDGAVSLGGTPSSATLQRLQNLHLYQQQQQLYHQQQTSLKSTQQQSQFDLNNLNTISDAVSAAARGGHVNNTSVTSIAATTNSNSSKTPNLFSSVCNTKLTSALMPPTVEDRSKKSQNMTECVPVPSSEHVAEIVGRQGCKIKALRAKTNTYIKTPVRGEEPVFVVTGRKEDVAKAKREILSAAEHFSLIRATRRPNVIIEGYYLGGGNNNGGGGNSASKSGSGSGRASLGLPTQPGQVTIQVRVPYRVVGLVVGPKGATIKHIQHETQTYIVTPSRDKEPIFEVSGLPDNVQTARKQIEAHIAIRTGNVASDPMHALSTPTNTIINTLSQILSADIDPDFLASLYKNGICSAFECIENVVDSGATVSDLISPKSVDGLSLSLTSNQLIIDSMNNCNNYALQGLNNTGTTVNESSVDYLNALSNFKTDMIMDGILQQQQQQNSRRHFQLQHIQNNGDAQQLVSNVNNKDSNLFTNINSTAMNLTGNSIITSSCVNGSSGVINTNIVTRSCSSASSTTSSKSANNSGGSASRPELLNIWKNLGDSIDIDEGIGESPNIWTLPTPSLTALTGSNCSPTASISPTDSLLGGDNSGGHGFNSYNISGSVTVGISGKTTILQPSKQQQQELINIRQQQQNSISSLGLRRECLICSDKEITAALVPCGHNMFCMECANRICTTGDATCPVCSIAVYHAMRILA